MAESNLAFIIAAYALTWIVIIGYIMYLGWREREERDHSETGDPFADDRGRDRSEPRDPYAAERLQGDDSPRVVT